MASMSKTHPHPKVARAAGAGRHIVTVGTAEIGPGTFTVIAGPCAVESEEQTLAAARMARLAGAQILRGGAFKPRTSPYAFQGLGMDGLKILRHVADEVGLPIVSEVVDARDVALMHPLVDMFQIGARNMQHFQLLREVGMTGKPALLKRGLSATIEEWLMAAEYIAGEGNPDVVLCERGIRTFETATRNTLDISSIPVVQQRSHLPIIVDPSHAGGDRALVAPLSKAALAVGADGLIIDVHPNPALALCDGPQALAGGELRTLVGELDALAPLLGRRRG